MSGKIDAGVQKCIAALKAAKNDTEKMAALFLVTKVVKGPRSLNRENKLALFEAIGFTFILRLLRSPSTPECPALLYKSVSLSVLTAFCAEPSIAQSPEMLEAIPIFLEIVESVDESNEDDDQLLMVVSEAYHCLKCLASVRKGRQALLKAGAIKRLYEVYTKGAFNSEESIEVIKGAAAGLGAAIWEFNPDAFSELMDRISLQFEADNSEEKFKMADVMASLMMSYNMTPEKVETAFWPQSIHKGLVDILTSKIAEKQRNPAIKLASVMLTTLGIEWMIKCSAEEGQATQFLVLLVHLSCIEVRMTLEDRILDKILLSQDLIGSCYGIIETIVKYMTGNPTEALDEKQREQIFTALKGAYSAILWFISLVRKEAEKNPKKFWDAKKKLIAVASVRCLAGWLAEDAASMKEEVYKQLPFILALVFEAYLDAEDEQSAESLVLAESGKSCEPLLPEILCQLLPALCHLTADERGVRMLLDAECLEMLHRFLTTNWQVYKNLKDLLERKSRPGKPGKKLQLKEGEPDLSVEELKAVLKRLRAAIMHTSNLFINISILDPASISENAVFQQIMRWAFAGLPSLTGPNELILICNVSSLGLLILLSVVKKATDAQKEGRELPPEEQFAASRFISGGDNSAFKFGQSVIRFVWDAHLPDETQSPTVLGLTSNYREVWMDIKEMWFLSLQTLGALMELCPWLADFAAESGFLEALIKNLSMVYKSIIESTTLAAYEEFFCFVAKSTAPGASKVMKSKGAALAASHHLRALTKVLKGEEAKK